MGKRGKGQRNAREGKITRSLRGEGSRELVVCGANNDGGRGGRRSDRDDGDP